MGVQATGNWLKCFFKEAGADFFLGDESSNWYQCLGWDKDDKLGDRSHTFEILMNRDLGGSRWPSKGWKNNSHN